MLTLNVIDSHTGGEPTRIIVDNGPDLGGGPLSERRERFRREFDHIRKAVILEPRGSDVLVGGLLCRPHDPACAAGVIFFNNAGYLNMCGHGTIGLAVTLRHLNRIGIGSHRIETPVGVVTVTLRDDHCAEVTNVPSYRYRRNVPVKLSNGTTVSGDIAWGGNWFYLCADHGQSLDVRRQRELTDFCLQIRQGLEASGITGNNGEVIDHIELFGPPSHAEQADSRNFVLCPGAAWDRSPCGTGTSAKLACLAADGKLSADSCWRQESIVGSIFEARFRNTSPVSADAQSDSGNQVPAVIPTIIGSAWVTGETKLLLNDTDPFRFGI